MESLFIQEIEIMNVRNIEQFQIPITLDKKNLIITGRNGSGKTTFIQALKQHLFEFSTHGFRTYENHLRELKIYEDIKFKLASLNPDSEEYDTTLGLSELWKERMIRYGGVNLNFTNYQLINEKYKKGEFIIAYFQAKRNARLNEPTGINKIPTQTVYQISENIGKQFIQYIVNLKADRSFAKDENDEESVQKIDNWFEVFESNLFQLFDSKNLQLVFNRKKYNFDIIEDGKEPYNLNQLSDGYSAIFNILTELIMRMEEHHSKNYDIQGIVLIDEIETHLHIELQKKILPFLTSFFPNVQFIVTTHSPFVINSIQGTVICDLEKKIVTTDLSGYSYDTIIESYFQSDKYSILLKEKMQRYEALVNKGELNDVDNTELFELKQFLYAIPKFISDELTVKLQQIKLSKVKSKKN